MRQRNDKLQLKRQGLKAILAGDAPAGMNMLKGEGRIPDAEVEAIWEEYFGQYQHDEGRLSASEQQEYETFMTPARDLKSMTLPELNRWQELFEKVLGYDREAEGQELELPVDFYIRVGKHTGK